MLDQAFLDREIYPRLDRAWVFQNLQPKDKGRYFECTCPNCGNRSAFAYKDKYKLHCNHDNNCGYEATILGYLNGGEKPTGQAYIDIIKRLCDQVGVKFPEKDLTPERAEAIRRSQEKAEAMETALSLAKMNVTGEVIAHLAERGMNPEHMHTMDLGSFQEVELLKELGIDERWIGRLVMAARDRYGKIKAFSGRLIEGEGEKYLHSKDADFKALGLAGLDVALSNGNGNIVVVEGLIDIYLWRSWGFKRIAACCGGFSQLTPERLQLLYKLGVRRIALATDNDSAGLKGLNTAIDNSLLANPCPELFVIPTRLYGGKKDPGELVGHVAMETLESHAEHAYRHKAELLLRDRNVRSDIGLESYINDCIAWDEPIRDARRIQKLLEFFWPAVQRISGSDLNGILDVREQVRAARFRQEQETALMNGVRDAQTALGERNIVKAVQTLQDAASFASKTATDYVAPILSVANRLASNTERLTERRGRTLIGLAQKTIPELDDYTLGLRRMITISSAPGTGKTIFMAQMIMDVLINNPDTCCVLVSWELTGDEIIDRMKCRLTGTKWEELQLRNSPELLERADRLMAEFADRLVILEQENCPDLNEEKILREVALLKQQTGCTHAVVGIDYFQIMPVPEHLEGAQEAQIEAYKVKVIKRIRYALDGDPVIVISEVNKNDGNMRAEGMEKLKGSVRLPYASDAVFLINPLNDEQLVRNIRLHNGGIVARPTYALSPEILPKPGSSEHKEMAKEIRLAIEGTGRDFLELFIVKIRDGGKRKRLLLTNYYDLSTMEPGIH